MSDRIRQLEDTVEGFQSQSSSSSHPLLRKELLSIKSTQELYGTDRGPNSSQRLLDSETHDEVGDYPQEPLSGQARRIEVLIAFFRARSCSDHLFYSIFCLYGRLVLAYILNTDLMISGCGD